VERVRVVVAYNDDAALKTHLNEIERIGEEEVADTAREVASLVRGKLLAVRDVRSAIAELRRDKPDVIFNLCEGVQGNPRREMHFALALEMLGIPFTGCDPVAVGICGDKWMTRRLLNASGIPAPRGFLVKTEDRGPRTEDLPDGTWIVKPSLEDAGIGIDADAVCSSRAEIASRCAYVIETYEQPALVEEFIDGRELNQALFYDSDGIVVLPPGEIVFSPQLAARQRVVGWKAKWSAGSAEDRATRNVTPAEVEEPVRRELADLCTRAANALSIGGYCRFDLRENTGFRKALSAAGIGFADFLNQLMIGARASRP
jgi:D-alanine-D-alanine ligase